jgi:hypothetical protein
MTLLRISLYTLALLFTLVLGAGIYAFIQLPTLVDEHARKYLNDYGVTKLSYNGLALTSNQLQLEELSVTGNLDEIHYRAMLSLLEVNFTWEDLAEGKVISIKAASVDLTITDRSTVVVESTPLKSLKISSFLPKQYLSQLPVELIDIQHWVLGYTDARAIPINVSGSFRYEHQLALNFETQLAGTSLDGRFWTRGPEQYPSASLLLKHLDMELGEISATVESESGDRWLWTATGEVDYSNLVTAVTSANESLDLRLDLSMLDQLQIQATSRFDLKVHHNDVIQLEPQILEHLVPQFDVELETNNKLSSLFLEKYIQNLSGELRISAALNHGLFHFALSPSDLQAELLTDSAVVPEDIQSWLKWGNTIPVHWNNLEDVTISSQKNGSWAANLKRISARIGDKKSQFYFQDLDLKANFSIAEKPEGSVSLNTRLTARLNRSQLPTLKLSIQLEGKKTDTRFKLKLDDIAQSISAGSSGRGNLSTGASTVALRLSSEDLGYASETILPLLHSLDLLSPEINPKISSGRLTLSSSLESRSFKLEDIELNSELSIDRLSGDYDSYAFQEAEMHAKWTGFSHGRTIEPVELSVAKLNLGIELLDTRMMLSVPKKTPISQPAVLISQFSSKIFGGEIYLPEPKKWDFGAESNNFIVRVKGWQLSDMVALQQDEDIQAQGTLEGQLPIELTSGRLIIADGFLRTVAPGGTIRYVANETSEALAPSNPELALALDLLSDFQFKVLSTEVELDDAGNLLLSLSLQGKNPSQFDGRPINFNINLEQNLDPLLQSLRLSDKLVETLESRLK